MVAGLIDPPAIARQRHSRYSRRHPLNLCHLIVKNGLLAAIIPFDGDASPIRFSDCARVILIVVPANTVADFELSGLVAGHWPCLIILAVALI